MPLAIKATHNPWIFTGCSAPHFYGFSDDELPEMVKLLPVTHEHLRK